MSWEEMFTSSDIETMVVRDKNNGSKGQKNNGSKGQKTMVVRDKKQWTIQFVTIIQIIQINM
jgi:hypothetical protein